MGEPEPVLNKGKGTARVRPDTASIEPPAAAKSSAALFATKVRMAGTSSKSRMEGMIDFLAPMLRRIVLGHEVIALFGLIERDAEQLVSAEDLGAVVERPRVSTPA
jgi:hypothetical protein